MLIRELVPVLQLSISPVIVISGVALTLLSMTNRYGHVSEKTRSLSNMIKKSCEEKSGHLHAQLHILFSRVRNLRRAIFLACLSLLLAAILIIVLFLVSLLQLEAAVVIVALFIGCMSAFSASLIFFLADINASMKALSLEFDSHAQNGPEKPSNPSRGHDKLERESAISK